MYNMEKNKIDNKRVKNKFDKFNQLKHCSMVK